MMLSSLQQRIVDSKEPRIITIAAAAAGKTAVLTEKLRQILCSGARPQEVAAITFTNMAAEEMRQRLGNDFKEGTFIGTVHSLANRFLVSSGVDTADIIDDEDFDKLFERIQDNPHCIKPIKYLLLDEAQDSSFEQFDFIFNMIQPENFFVVGDERQCIYRFAGSDPRLLKGLQLNGETVTYSLNENYRNGWQILNFAKRIIEKTGLYDDSVPMRGVKGKVIEEEFAFSNVVKHIQNKPDYKNWFVLCRTNAQVEQVMGVLEKAEIPCESFRQADLKREELIERMENESVKVLTIHSSKGLAADNVIVIGAQFFSDEEKSVAYVAATRARNLLIWEDTPLKRRPRARAVKTMTSWE